MNTTDTICAPATGIGGAVAIMRLAGEGALEVANRVWRGRTPLSAADDRVARLGRLVATGEPALALCMFAPRSYTGDDVVELQLHGGAVAMRNALEAAIAAGARLAEAGEFTFRAFVNGKLDLTQAEAVADLVAAGSDAALLLATRQLSGALGSRIAGLRGAVVDVLADAESRLDFPDEHLDWAPPAALVEKLHAVSAAIADLAATGRAGAAVREGVRVALAGRPNAGKSSLLNALLGRDRAIVSAIAGTTRDTIEENLSIRGIPVRIADTAGLRANATEVESLGIERSYQTIRSSDLVFWLLDASGFSAPPDPAAELGSVRCPVIAVWNKCDLPHGELPQPTGCTAVVEISALDPSTLPPLLDAFERAVWRGAAPSVPEVAVNSRHLAGLNAAASALASAVPELENSAWELAAVHLRAAADSLGSLTGETAALDVLDNIFSRFCIGK